MNDDAVVRGRPRAKHWVRVGHGVYRTEDATDLHAWQSTLPPSGRFTHLTAAAVLGWALPPLPDALPVFSAVNRTDSRPQRAGLRVTRNESAAPARVLLDLRIDPPTEILLACARDLGVLDLVVLADSALRAGHVTVSELSSAAAARRRGAPALRAALDLVDHRAESPYETLLRVLHLSCGVHVEPQYELRDDRGDLIARADLWLRGTCALHEYDGGDHLDVRRQRKDLARARRIGNHDWVRRGYTARDVLHQGVSILRDADLSLERPHDPSRIRRWHALLAASLFSSSGRAALESRLGLRRGPGSG
jgi:hypothetical protein